MNANKTLSIIVTITAVIILVVAGGIRLKSVSSANQNNCTEEALMCPDGTSVVRSGLSCEFAACPAQDFYIGTLSTSIDGDLSLSMQSLLPDAKEPYLIPLRFADARGVDAYVNRPIAVRGQFVVGNIFMVETYGNPPNEVVVGTPSTNTTVVQTPTYTLGRGDVAVSVGQSKSIDGLVVELESIIGDSRCPVGVQCIQAGWVDASVSLSTTGETSKTVNIRYAANTIPVKFGNYSVSIADVTPANISGKAISIAEYTVIFHVEKAPVVTAGAEGVKCTESGGLWNATHKECGGIDANKCSAIGGIFNECGSACRHNPNAEMCTLQCVQYCQM